jgi:hypothetical protein
VVKGWVEASEAHVLIDNIHPPMCLLGTLARYDASDSQRLLGKTCLNLRPVS